MLNARMTQALGRPFGVQGDLSVQWAQEGQENNWRRWVPWPHLSAHDIVIGNPAGIDHPENDTHFVGIKQVDFSVNPTALFDMKVMVPTLVLRAPDLSLLRNADGKNNWTFDFGSTPSRWKLNVNRLVVDNGVLTLNDAVRKAQVKAEVDTVDDNSQQFGLSWTVSGNLNGAPIDGKGKAGALLSFESQSAPYPLLADVHIGKTHIKIDGNLTKPSQLAALDLRLALSGINMADLYPITGITLPDTPPFQTEGRLTGAIDHGGIDFHYEGFKGRVGSSDLSGSLEYQSARSASRVRPLLSGKVTSDYLLFSDLGAIVGADSNAGKLARGAPPAPVSDKVLPTQKLKFDRWRSIDVDVQFVGRKIIRSQNLPIDNLITHIQLRDGTLALLPLQFGIAGGTLVSNIQLNGNGSLLKAALSASARHVQINQLSPDFKPMKTSFGEISGDIKLSGTGNSVAALLASSNGEFKPFVSRGSVSKLLLDEAGLNVLNILLTKLFGDKQVQINCVGGDFLVTNGMMQTRNFVIDTDETAIGISGQIDLANERLALTVKPENKKFRVVSLRAPIYVSGTFKTPGISIDKGAIALRTAGATILGLLSPVAALVPLVDVAGRKQSVCDRGIAFAETSTKPSPLKNR